MVPQENSDWHSLAVGHGAMALLALLRRTSTSVRSSHNHHPQSLDCGDDLKSAGPKEADDPQIGTVDNLDQTRLARAYKTARTIHRSDLSATDRSAIPGMMQSFRWRLDDANLYGLIDWLAERDALIDRAQALGYVIGELRGVISGASSWSAIGIGKICGADFGYPTGSQVSWRTPAPVNGNATLLNRGWAMLDDKDNEPRPYIPIPRLFLPEPTMV